MRSASPAARGGCEICGKPQAICVCDRVTPLANGFHVLILQHPQEQDVALGSVPLLLTSLTRSTRAIGLSWPSLSKALGHEADPKQWAVMYPSSLPRRLTETEHNASFVLMDRKGEPTRGADGIVLLDGTWSQAKALWWRNAWLLKLNRLLVHPKEPSIYGKLRKEPRREYVSTLEAAGAALTALGDDPMIEATLRKLFRTMLQRARDVPSR